VAVRIDLRIGCLGERMVSLAPFLRGHRAVDGRANQGVTEHDARSQLEETFGFECGRSGIVDPKALGGPPQECRIASRLRGGDEQQAPRVRREFDDPASKARLDATRNRHRHREGEPAGQLRGCQPPRELEQGERVAMGLGDDPFQDGLAPADRGALSEAG